MVVLALAGACSRGPAAPSRGAPPAVSIAPAPSAARVGVSPPSQEGEPAPVPSESGDQVRLERGACLGSCPVYAVTIHRDGSVLFDGRAYSPLGATRARIAPAAAAALLDELTRAKLLELTWDEDCGKPKYVDLPLATLTLRVAGKLRTHRFEPGETCAPPVLEAFGHRIDEVAGTDRWLRSR